MKVWKKCGVLFLTVLLCITMMAVPALAASDSQDGLEVTLTTDKEEYSKGEKIVATLEVTNTNDTAVSNVSLENLIPEGYNLTDGSETAKQVESLGSGETVSLTVSYVAEESDADGDKPNTGDDNKGNTEKPDTGDNSGNTGNIGENKGNTTTDGGTDKGKKSDVESENKNNTAEKIADKTSLTPTTGDNTNIAVWIVLALIAGGCIIVLLILKKFWKKIIALFLGVLIVGIGVVGISPTAIKAASSNVKVIEIQESVLVNEISVKLEAKVSYCFNEQEKSDVLEDFDLSLGNDVIPDLDFEPEEATPTFESKEQEVANIAELNGGEVPYAACDNNGVPNYIDGKFSDKIVDSAENAIEALNDIHHIMGFENAKQEFEEDYSQMVSLGETTGFYRLQQVYHNIPVYGYNLVVSTNSSGEIASLSGHYLSDLDVDTQPAINVEAAKGIVKQKFDISEMRSDGLFIYALNDNQPVLVWKITAEKCTYFINAVDGTIVNTESNALGIQTGNGIDMSGESIEFPVYSSDDFYYMRSDDKKIFQGDSDHSNMSGEIVKVTDNTIQEWSQFPEAISAYSNMIKTFDFYSNTFGHSGADKRLKPIYITVNYRKDNSEAYANAYFTDAYEDKTVLRIGDYTNYAQALDVIAHEFTHAVNDAIWDPEYMNESGAIDEAYADIIGELIENGKLEYIGEDLNSGTLRSFIKPSEFGDSDDFASHKKFCKKNGHHDCECGDKEDHYCDNGYVHSNSGIINHAAYLMDQNWPETNHAKELATLFYKSMYYLASSTPNSDFLDCRHAVLAAAKSMNMSNEKRNVIATAFSDVGVKYEDDEVWASAHHISGVVKDAETDSPIIDAKVIAVATRGLGGGIGYSDGTGNYDVKVNRAVYTVFVFADGYRSYKVENVDLSSWFNMNYYMETIYLTPAAWRDDTQNVFASGKIINALTGENLEGVTIKFRSGSNNQSGAYIQTDAGLDIELTTDDSGQYYTAALSVGNYTLEASKDGFITGYSNIISGNSVICSNQNVSLTPELNADTIRIVLTWGENPSDLDSHVEGTLSNGDSFHVYYGYPSQYDGDVEVCNLDVDDISSYGPETITLNPTNENPYYYYIHRYYGFGTVASSGAQVKVYQGGNLLATFNVPTDQGNDDYWNVFAIVNGELVVQNTITFDRDISYAGTGTSEQSSNFTEESIPKEKVKDVGQLDNSFVDKTGETE